MKKNKSIINIFMQTHEIILRKLFAFWLIWKVFSTGYYQHYEPIGKKAGKNKTVFATSTFNYTRIVDGHSVENLPANVLDVRISHRFGPLNSGVYNFFGLDYSSCKCADRLRLWYYQ